MTVKEIMTTPPLTCTADASLAVAARLMGEAGYGAIAVLNAHDRLAGILTDRDICLALGESHRNALSIATHEAMTAHVFTVGEDDDVRTALTTMKQHRVRRVPVLDRSQRVTGLLSIEDVLIRGIDDRQISANDLVAALRTMCTRLPAVEPALPDNGYTPG